MHRRSLSLDLPKRRSSLEATVSVNVSGPARDGKGRGRQVTASTSITSLDSIDQHPSRERTNTVASQLSVPDSHVSADKSSDDGDDISLTASILEEEFTFIDRAGSEQAADFDTLSVAGFSVHSSSGNSGAAQTPSIVSGHSELEFMETVKDWDELPPLEYYPWPAFELPTVEINLSGLRVQVRSGQMDDLSLFASSNREPAPTKPIKLTVIDSHVAVLNEAVIAEAQSIVDPEMRRLMEGESSVSLLRVNLTCVAYR